MFVLKKIKPDLQSLSTLKRVAKEKEDPTTANSFVVDTLFQLVNSLPLPPKNNLLPPMHRLEENLALTLPPPFEDDSSSSDASMLETETPPLSPFFARVTSKDILETRDTMERAGRSRRSTLFADSPSQRATWCTPIDEPVFQSLRRPKHRSWLDTPTKPRQHSISMLFNSPLQPPKMRWEEEEEDDDDDDFDWLMNQEPPKSPQFADILGFAEEEEVVLRPREKSRWYQIGVYSKDNMEVCEAREDGKLVKLDPRGKEVQKVLKRYPHVLDICRSQHQYMYGKTGMQKPTRLLWNHKILNRPKMAWLVSNAIPRSVDKAARTVDIAAMVEKYLPSRGRCNTRASSEDGSTATLVEQPVVPKSRRLRASKSVVNLKDPYASSKLPSPGTIQKIPPPHPQSALPQFPSMSSGSRIATPTRPRKPQQSMVRRSSAEELVKTRRIPKTPSANRSSVDSIMSSGIPLPPTCYSATEPTFGTPTGTRRQTRAARSISNTSASTPTRIPGASNTISTEWKRHHQPPRRGLNSRLYSSRPPPLPLSGNSNNRTGTQSLLPLPLPPHSRRGQMTMAPTNGGRRMRQDVRNVFN